MTLYTVTAVARQLGLSTRRVREICQEHGIGLMAGSRLRILAEADIAKVAKCRRPRGRPPGSGKKIDARKPSGA
jgi:hypothetical protein